MDDDQVEVLKTARFADLLFEQAKAHQEVYIAGMKAADENSPAARKLAKLIVKIERMAAWLERGTSEDTQRLRSTAAANLREAIREAREP